MTGVRRPDRLQVHFNFKGHKGHFYPFQRVALSPISTAFAEEMRWWLRALVLPHMWRAGGLFLVNSANFPEFVSTTNWLNWRVIIALFPWKSRFSPLHCRTASVCLSPVLWLFPRCRWMSRTLTGKTCLGMNHNIALEGDTVFSGESTDIYPPVCAGPAYLRLSLPKFILRILSNVANK